MPALFTRMSSGPNAFFASENRRSTVRLLRDIGLHRNGLAALAGDLGHHAVGAVLAGGVVDDDRRAFIRQMRGDGGADSLGCAGHDRHLVRELAHVLVPHVRLRPPVAVGIAVKTCVIRPADRSGASLRTLWMRVTLSWVP
jgi:hypothetical protein